jgi:hypothetical protein
MKWIPSSMRFIHGYKQQFDSVVLARLLAGVNPAVL